jgi:protease-4
MRRCLSVGLSCVALLAVAFPSPVRAAGDTVAVFELKGAITEKPAAEDFPFATVETESLQSLVKRLDQAAKDPKVAAVVVMADMAQLGYAQLEEISTAIDRIQAAGKPVYAHTDWTMTGGYALLSGVDRLSVTPTGYLIVTGLYGEQPYLRGLLDKLGVQPDFLTCGDYKSAGEMFMRTEPSPEAKKMYGWLYDGLFDGTLQHIAAGRKVDVAQARKWIDEGLYSAESAHKAGLIDAVEYRDQFLAHIREKHGEKVKFDRRYGKKSQQTIDLNNPFAVMQFYMDLLAGPKTTKSTKDAVAIVYVEGGIMPGSPEPSLFGPVEGAYSDPIRKALDEAAEDNTVKAVVLRVDSPGGSAVASEVILHASQRLAEKKPLIVSMGNVAGSGGYYVSLGSKIVYADATTITGSIGVITGKIATTDMWKKIGVTFDPIARGKRSALFGTATIFSEDERKHVQGWMDEVYGEFKQHVVDIRGDKLTKPIDELAGGRVYTGKQALDLGLVDEIGDLNAAIARAAKEAKVETYEVRIIPRPKNFIEMLAEDLSGGQSEEKNRLSLPAGLAPQGSLWDAALPLLKGADPHRVELLRRAFGQLDLIQRETVIMAMPVIDLP